LSYQLPVMTKLSEALSTLIGELIEKQVREDLSRDYLLQQVRNSLFDIFNKLPPDRRLALSATLIPLCDRIDPNELSEIKRCLGYTFCLSMVLDVFNDLQEVNCE
jgi:hypothetical protein